MTSLHWLIVNVVAWVSSALAAGTLDQPMIMYAPGVFTCIYVIAAALTGDLSSNG